MDWATQEGSHTYTNWDLGQIEKMKAVVALLFCLVLYVFLTDISRFPFYPSPLSPIKGLLVVIDCPLVYSSGPQTS